MKKFAMVLFALCLPQVSSAAGLINEMQTCQGLLDFMEQKISAVSARYDVQELNKVRKGLDAYNGYIQREIVTPGLLQATGGNKAMADAYQKQVDAYKAGLVKQLAARYPQDKLLTDHAVAVNECSKKAVPSGAELESLKEALTTMVKLARAQ